MLEFTPQDHKCLIYSLLDIRSLMKLGITNKAFHNDKNLILILVQKIVDSYFFCSEFHLGVVHNWLKFPHEKLFYQIYMDKLKKLSFDNLELIKDPKTNYIRSLVVHNQLRTFEINDPMSHNYHIHIFIDAILSLPRSEKKKICTSLLQFIGSIFSYTSGLNFHRLGHLTKQITGFNFFIHQVGVKIFKQLRQLFENEIDLEMKKFMIMEVDRISKILNKRDPEAGESYEFRIFSIDRFISVNYDEHIKEVVDIGDILLSLDKRDEFCSLYQSFIDELEGAEGAVSPDHMKKTYYQLKMKYKGGSLTYEEKLIELLNQVGLNAYDFEWISEFV